MFYTASTVVPDVRIELSPRKQSEIIASPDLEKGVNDEMFSQYIDADGPATCLIGM